MKWEEKLHVLNALGDCSLMMRKPGDWYVSQSVEIKQRGSSILSGAYGNGNTPAAAVEDHWRRIVAELPDDCVVVVDSGTGQRRHVRWTGFMWEESPIRHLPFGA